MSSVFPPPVVSLEVVFSSEPSRPAISAPACMLGWSMLTRFVCALRGKDLTTTKLHFRYTDDFRSPENKITREDWISGPFRLEIVADNPRHRRVYAFFTRRSPRLAASCITQTNRSIWWSNHYWESPPYNVDQCREGNFDGASSLWIRITQAKPLWLDAYMRRAPQACSRRQPSRRQQSRSRIVSPFLQLPRELRYIIYEYILNFDSVGIWLDRLSSETFKDDKRWIFHTPSILLVNRQCHQEAARILHGQPLRLHRGIEVGSQLRRNISHIIRPTLLRHLRNVSFAYTIPAGVRHFRECNILSFIRVCERLVSEWLENGHNLQTLRISITSTDLSLGEHFTLCTTDDKKYCLILVRKFIETCRKLNDSVPNLQFEQSLLDCTEDSSMG